MRGCRRSRKAQTTRNLRNLTEPYLGPEPAKSRRTWGVGALAAEIMILVQT